MTTALRLTTETSPAPGDSRVVLDGLRAFNVAVIGEPNETPFGIFVRDADDRVLGGLLGFTKWRWMYVAKLWLPDALRGQGYGARLMAEAERHARALECLGIHLDTSEYQAPRFYQKLGFEVFGVLEGYPPGYRTYYLKKAL